jgi:hypothetical protein
VLIECLSDITIPQDSLHIFLGKYLYSSDR